MKIMIFTAATGGGHLRASGAMEDFIKQNSAHEVVVVDTLKTIGTVLDKTVCNSYLFMARNVPSLFGRLYKQTNRESRFSSLVPKLNSAFSHSLLSCIAECNPDIIVTNHPFATEMISHLKETGDLLLPLICLITDYGLHRAWLADNVDAYVVASEEMIPQLQDCGVNPSKIYPFGIPVYGVFFASPDKAAIYKELQFEKDVPTILFMAGSFGVSNIMKLYKDLIASETPMQIIIITGKNKKLYEAFERELKSLGDASASTRLVFFTSEVEKYMQVSDLIVTKPGGLTVSEALACNLPLAVFDAIPGQEEDNANFLVEKGMGVRLEKNEDISAIISDLITNREKLDAMRENCITFDKSKSMDNILQIAEELTHKYNFFESTARDVRHILFSANANS